MATGSKCTACSHGSTWHDSSGKCKIAVCNCGSYTTSGSAMKIESPRVASQSHYATTSATGGLFDKPLPPPIETKTVAGGQLPTVRHDPQIQALLRKAAVHAIAQIQTGVWDSKDLRKIAEVAAARGCERCRVAVDNSLSSLTAHITPQHVAEAFGLFYDADVRLAAADQMESMLQAGMTSSAADAADDWVRGWRQFAVTYDKGTGEVMTDGLVCPTTVFPRLWLYGAQGSRWITGDYAAHCSGQLGRARVSRYNNYLVGDAARQQCLEHYSQQGRTVNRQTLEIIEKSAECTCGVYAVTNRHGIHGGNASTGGGMGVGGPADYQKTIKAQMVAYGIIQIGADNESWRATDAMIERLVFYPGVLLDAESRIFPEVRFNSILPYTRVEHNYRQFAQDLCDIYKCPVTFASKSTYERNLLGQFEWVDTEEFTVNPEQTFNLNMAVQQ